jgi:hypothetical protein
MKNNAKRWKIAKRLSRGMPVAELDSLTATLNERDLYTAEGGMKCSSFDLI